MTKMVVMRLLKGLMEKPSTYPSRIIQIQSILILNGDRVIKKNINIYKTVTIDNYKGLFRNTTWKWPHFKGNFEISCKSNLL